MTINGVYISYQKTKDINDIMESFLKSETHIKMAEKIKDKEARSISKVYKRGDIKWQE